MRLDCNDVWVYAGVWRDGDCARADAEGLGGWAGAFWEVGDGREEAEGFVLFGLVRGGMGNGGWDLRVRRGSGGGWGRFLRSPIRLGWLEGAGVLQWLPILVLLGGMRGELC